MKKTVWAARPFGYGEYPSLDVGQVITIEYGAQRNDEKLLRLGLLREVTSERPVSCGRCGAQFLDEGHLNRHGRNRHALDPVAMGRQEDPNADLSTAEALGNLRALEAADKFAEAAIPLDLSKTKASKAAGRRASR